MASTSLDAAPDTIAQPAHGRSLSLACVIDDLGTGGAQRLVSVLARELCGHDVSMVVISLGARDEERAALAAYGVEVHTLPAAGLASPARLIALVRLLRRLEPDLVHTHLLASHILGGMAARWLRLPVISTLHNVDPHPRFAGTWKRRAESLCLRFATTRVIAVGPNVAATNRRRLGGRAIDVLANPLSASIATSEGDDDLQQSRRTARERLSALVGSTPATRHLVTVGRLASEKGWPAFLDVVDKLRSSHPDCLLIAVGDGPLEESIRRAVQARGLGAHVRLVGRRDDLHTFYLGSDVFVLNSTIEGLPMALLEAMAVGLPVVSTRVGDVEHAAGGDVAMLVDPGRVDEMVEALQHVLDEPAAARSRGLRGRRRALAEFGIAQWTRSLLTMYRESILTNGGGGSLRGAASSRPRDGDVSEPLQIVEFVDGLNTGGAQALLALRARNARRMGYRIDLVSLGSCAVISEELIEHVDAIHAFPSQHVFDIGRIIRICKLLRKLKPDVVLTHLRTSNTVGALCGRLTGIPVVSTLHITFPELGLEHRRRDWAEKWALRLGARDVMGVGPSVVETHQPRLGDKLIEIVPNPVELPADGLDPAERKASARAALDLPFDTANAQIVLSVGRLTHVKGALDGVQTIERLHRSSTRDRAAVKLLVVGDGEIHDELQHSIEARGLGDSVFLLGRSERVRELMAASDVFLLNSRAEGLPLVLLEAMSMHLPVVATRVGDVPWLLGDGAYGELIDPGDVAASSRAVAALLESPEKAHAVAARAHERVRDVFSVETWLREVDRILRSATGGGATTRGRQQFAMSSRDDPEDAERLRERVTGLVYRDQR